MSELDLDKLRDDRTGCPSDFAMDRWIAGECDAAVADELETHVAQCEACSTWVADRREGFSAFSGLDADGLLGDVLDAVDIQDQSARPAWWARWRWPVWGGALATLAAASVVFVVLPTESPEPAPDHLRAKGNAALRVYQLRGDKAEEILSGASVEPGSQLRFGVDLPTRARIRIVGVEHDGYLYTAWPLAGVDAPDVQKKGDNQLLPGAVTVDDSPGRETLYLVHCPTSAVPPKCTSRGAEQPPMCPDGCGLAGFVIHKGEAAR